MACSSTSNETLSGGTNISVALQEYFPALTETDIQEFVALYPLNDYDSPSQQFQVATGEPDVICGVSLIGSKAPVILTRLPVLRQREAMGGPASLFSGTWTYRYNTPNPTSGSDVVAHAAENWMMFDGINTG